MVYLSLREIIERHPDPVPMGLSRNAKFTANLFADYWSTLYLEDPTPGGPDKVELVAFARNVDNLPCDREGSAVHTKPNPGDIIRLEKVDLKYYQGRPQLNLQVAGLGSDKMHKYAVWSLFTRHPPTDEVPEAPYASSSVSDTYRCSEEDLSRLATFRSALDDREAKAAALQQQNQQAAQPLPPLPLQYDIQVLMPPPHWQGTHSSNIQHQQQQQQQLQQQQQPFASMHAGGWAAPYHRPAQHPPPLQCVPTTLEEVTLVKVEGLAKVCVAPSRVLVDVICKVLAVDYRNPDYTVLFVWDATDAASLSRTYSVPPCVPGSSCDSSGLLPLWSHHQPLAMPLAPIPPPKLINGNDGQRPVSCWKGGADVVASSKMPRIGSAVPVVVPHAVAVPALLCSKRGTAAESVRSPISAGMEVKLCKVSPCVVKGQAQLLFSSNSKCMVRDERGPEGGNGKGSSTGKRGAGQQQQQQQSNKRGRATKLDITVTLASRKAEQQQQWEQLDMPCRQPQDVAALAGDECVEHTHLATRVLLPPNHSHLPPKRGTVRDVLMAFEEDHPNSSGETHPFQVPQGNSGASEEGAHPPQQLSSVPPVIVIARILGHYFASAFDGSPESGIRCREDGLGQGLMCKVLIEDATGELDAVIMGRDVETFLESRIPYSSFNAEDFATRRSRDVKMEAALRWLETGVPDAPPCSMATSVAGSTAQHSTASTATNITVGSTTAGSGQQQQRQLQQKERRQQQDQAAELDGSRLCKERGGHGEREGGNGAERGGGRGRGRGGGRRIDGGASGSRRGVLLEGQQQQPLCELMIHPMNWDAGLRGMQFYRVIHTKLAPSPNALDML